ncbi:xanthine dehydrogenase large subunit [Inhella inkyongensis]|uniref:Xanthine dehydrogenase large subunit n=1 Tax=Inhella inkyongensis TaxID=392593 RepID=A0A840S8M6_9BURK|nr:xanthine dehydrogenase molybdopterin binding subunit [Inhella inkyongensis]MBB5205356.1 xanthine dehydrogenase large subunit [Inhella inkyongensis]
MNIVVGKPLPHESAHLHVQGSAPYTDDIPERVGTLHAALGLSPVAHGRLLGVDVERVRAQPGVVDVFTGTDFPGRNDCGPLIQDDPILAIDTLRYRGQPVFAVVARTRAQARRAAALAREVIQAEPLTAILHQREAHAAGQHVIAPMQLCRGDADQALANAPQRLQLAFELGGQEQFYLEGQISYALPEEDGGLTLHCSTQHPSEMQHLVAHALHRPNHAVRVLCRRMGGGFGGKESQSALFACVAALGAVRNRAPVKLRLDRDDDFLITGRRHGFSFDIDAGFDEAGRIQGVRATLISNAGHSADLSGPVLTRALCHFDNAYWLPHVALSGFAARTNTQSNTAFRGFGGPQGALAVEMLMDAIARRLKLDPLAVRRANLYQEGQTPPQTTPYGQTIEDFCLPDLMARLEASSDYAARRAAVAAFNASSPVLKKGLALTPLKFGISFNVVHLNQAGALVHVYTDGSVLVNHGGTEMGQGLNTKVAQVVAQELGLPLAAVRCSATDTEKIANTSATAASTGADLNGKAAQAAARSLRDRLSAFAAQAYGLAPDGVRFEAGEVVLGSQRIAWEELVRQAYHARVQLWSEGFYATPGLSWDRAKLQGRPFYYFAHGAAVAEVLVDTLTGEHRVLRADALHDVGQSLNPAIDIGQVEGAFIQGMGWLTSEELVWHPADGSPKAGLLVTHAPSTYKIPTANDCPADFRVALFDRPNAKDSIHRSKAVGEPPLLLPFAVFLAIKDAVAAATGGEPTLMAPATPEAVLKALHT